MADIPAIRSGSGISGDPRPAGQARLALPKGVSFAAHLKGAALPLTHAGPARAPLPLATRYPPADAGLGTGANPPGRTSHHAADDGCVGDERLPHRSPSSPSPGDLLDPLTRSLYSPGFTAEKAAPVIAGSQGDVVAAASRVSLEHLMSRFVRRVAWSGDAHTGTARLEFGAGALEGGTLIIRSDHGAVSISLELPPGVDGTEWRNRIARRLAVRGLQVAAIEID